MILNKLQLEIIKKEFPNALRYVDENTYSIQPDMVDKIIEYFEKI